MKRALALAALTLLTLPGLATSHPHRYVNQQAAVAIGRDAVQLTVRIVPSLQDGAAIVRHIDSDGGGTISRAEADALGTAIIAAATLEVDGRRTAFGPATVSVSDAAAIAAGAGSIEVRATAPLALAPGPEHRLTFDIAYGEFSHDWFVQPFFYPDVAAFTPTVERSDTESRVVIVFRTRTDAASR